jgi:hypothetical protein
MALRINLNVALIETGATVSGFSSTGTGPFQSFQWFDKLTMSGVIVMLLRSVPIVCRIQQHADFDVSGILETSK